MKFAKQLNRNWIEYFESIRDKALEIPYGIIDESYYLVRKPIETGTRFGIVEIENPSP